MPFFFFLPSWVKKKTQGSISDQADMETVLKLFVLFPRPAFVWLLSRGAGAHGKSSSVARLYRKEQRVSQGFDCAVA